MFQKALEVAAEFTFPYVGVRRRNDGEVFSTVGAVVMLNSDGWCLTAAHVVDEIRRARASVRSKTQPTTLSHHVEIWAVPGFGQSKPRMAEAHVDTAADVAAVRIDPFDAGLLGRLPVFRSLASPVMPGLSVCRVGYPFHKVEATFDEGAGNFDIKTGFPVPRFALEGMVSRFHNVVVEGRETPARFIETSTPGLRGQSGGPLIDVEGRVCGIQSHTAHLDLGFDASFERDGERVTERQFLNVGRAVHVEQVMAFLDSKGIEYGQG